MIAAEIDRFNDDDATMKELSENEDFYPKDDLREENKNEFEPEEDNHSDDNLDEDFVVTLPATHTVVTMAYLAQLKNNTKKLRRLEKAAYGGNTYRGTALGRRFLCAAMIQNPAMSFYSFKQIMPLVISTLFADVSLDIDDMAIGRSWPSANTLKNILCDCAADAIIRIRELIAINNAPVFFQCNKGHRKGVDHFVKLVTVPRLSVCWQEDASLCEKCIARSCP